MNRKSFVKNLAVLGLVQSTRGYLPKAVSHYTAYLLRTWISPDGGAIPAPAIVNPSRRVRSLDILRLSRAAGGRRAL
jgi:hypothetical protein